MLFCYYFIIITLPNLAHLLGKACIPVYTHTILKLLPETHLERNLIYLCEKNS